MYLPAQFHSGKIGIHTPATLILYRHCTSSAFVFVRSFVHSFIPVLVITVSFTPSPNCLSHLDCWSLSSNNNNKKGHPVRYKVNKTRDDAIMPIPTIKE